VLEGLGPCVPLKPGAELDWLTGCLVGEAGPACAGDSFDAVDLAWGRGASCDDNGSTWTCGWDGGLQATFDVEDEDSVEPGGDRPANLVRALSTFDGSDPDGLGVEISLRCWVGSLGPPSDLLFVDDPGELVPVEGYWDDYGVDVQDVTRADDGAALPDGLIDTVTLYGAP
jgi:hypothetical protein